MTVNKVSLNDRFDIEKKIVIASGTQALVRLMLNQAVRDRVNGINSAGLVTGYRGSPLGGVDATFTKAEKFLKKNNIKFQYGLNEDLAATAIWGLSKLNCIMKENMMGFLVFGMVKAQALIDVEMFLDIRI